MSETKLKPERIASLREFVDQGIEFADEDGFGDQERDWCRDILTLIDRHETRNTCAQSPIEKELLEALETITNFYKTAFNEITTKQRWSLQKPLRKLPLL